MNNYNEFFEMDPSLKPYMTQEEYNFMRYIEKIGILYVEAVELSDDGIVDLPAELMDPIIEAKMRRICNIRYTVESAKLKVFLHENKLAENN